MPDDKPLNLSDVLREEFVRLHGDLPKEIVDKLDAPGADEAAKLRALYRAIHALPEKRSAFCISGGGIRSATFALGVIQRLADYKLLSKFDFLSTVSGGGYIGGWLSSFIRRNPGGAEDVESGINGAPDPNRDPLEPEIAPLTWLRQFSNYLTPKLGLFSGDTWAFAGSYVRNVLLVWLMFVPFLAALLAIPRLFISLLRFELLNLGCLPEYSAALAGLLILIGTAVVACTRPVSYRIEGWLTNGRFQRFVLLPYFLAAVLLLFFWGARHATFDDWGLVFAALIGINIVASLIYMARFFRVMWHQRAEHVRADSSKKLYGWKKLLTEIIASGFAGATGCALLYAVSQLFEDPLTDVFTPTLEAWQVIPPHLSKGPAEVYLCVAVPLVLGVLFVQSAIFVGLSSWFNEEYDREWWGRAGGWVLLASLAWVGSTAITIYGPMAIYRLPATFAALAGSSGLVSILLGRSGKTSANSSDKKEGQSTTSSITSIVLGLVGPIFAVCVLALISLCTSRILLAVDPPERIPEAQLARAAAGTYQISEPIKLQQGPATFKTSTFPAVQKERIASIEHLWAIDTTSIPEGLLMVFGLGIWAWLISFFIGANQFSMHGLYRDRLIRGFLGASRWKRTANDFSGFDPSDNFPMYRMRPEMFWGTTFVNIARDGKKIVDDPILSGHIHSHTHDAVMEAVSNPNDPNVSRRAGDLLADDLNHAVLTLKLAPKGQQPQAVVNRRELETHFPGAFQPMELHRRPLHVVNTTLNLVGGDDLAWQERKASSFAISPLFTGGLRVCYRPTHEYGGANGVTLGTAVAISGAAASPNMGYNSSPALSFLLTLFNVRLGWWYGNPKKETYTRRNPANTLVTVLNEALGMTNDEHDYIYLSDGGHFENLGIYEMVLRRCRYIVMTDASGDPEFHLSDLGMAIRKIRIDLGINIEIDEMMIKPRNPVPPLDPPPQYYAVGKIKYSDVDGPGTDGLFLYIKPTFYGQKEPKDVYNYAQTYGSFPHQSTGDQWFSESQFESYRQLGYFALGQAANGTPAFPSVAELIKSAGKIGEAG